MALVYYADNLILGAPIVALTVWLGGLTAFLILTPVYFAFDYMLGRLTLRIVIEEEEAKNYGRLMRFIRRWFRYDLFVLIHRPPLLRLSLDPPVCFAAFLDRQIEGKRDQL